MSVKKLIKIGYFADGPWSHNAFKLIVKDSNFKISFIVVRNDTQDPILKEYAKEHEIPFLHHPKINSDEFHKILDLYEFDLFVSMSFNQIFKDKTILKPRLGTINCHAGKLPFYRGRNILNWALINDEKEFGITVHYMDEGIDTGDIILQKTYSISDEDNYETLLTRSYTACADILYDALGLFVSGDVKRQKQSEVHPLGMYCTMRKSGDENLNWSQKSRDIFNFVRAICKPGPQARTWLNEKELKINKVECYEEAPSYKGVPGAILGKDKEGFMVKTEDSYVKVIDYEYDGVIKMGDRLV